MLNYQRVINGNSRILKSRYVGTIFQIFIDISGHILLGYSLKNRPEK